jgi:malonate transporter
MLMLIITALLPVFLAIALGYFAGLRKLIDNKNVASLNVMLMQFVLPLTLFVSIAKTPRTVIAQNAPLAVVLALGLCTTFGLVALVQIRLFRLSLGDTAVETLTITFPNFSSIGLPLLLPIFGPEAALTVAIAIAVGSVTISPMTLAMLELHKAHAANSGHAVSPLRQFGLALGRSVRKPIFIGPVLGLLFVLAGLKLSVLTVTAFGPLTAATAGLGLFLTGLMVSAQPIRVGGNVLFGTAVKNVAQPLLVYALALAMGLPIQTAKQTALLTAIPSGFFGLLFGANNGLSPPVAGSTLVFSSLAGIATLGFAIWLLAPAS